MKKSENILLLGLGGLGFYLTKRLSQEGHQVTVIERDPVLIEKVNENWTLDLYKEMPPTFGRGKKLQQATTIMWSA